MKHYRTTEVVSNRNIARGLWLMKFKCPDLEAHAGQFLNVYFNQRPQLFPRPFSIAGYRDDNLLILYKVVGQLTESMSQWKRRQPVRILAPLGNAFSLADAEMGVLHILVGGGVGAAPLMFLRDELLARGVQPVLYLGARTADELPLHKEPRAVLRLSTDDGSSGFKGTVVAHLQNDLKTFNRPVQLYACGPAKMLGALIRLSYEERFPIQVSVETLMACGLGLCQGCAIHVRRNGNEEFALVCKDGPVFNGHELLIDG